jgi:hypothetical protein
MPMDSVPQVPPIEISVKSLPEYVRGLPAYLAVTITAPPGTAFSGLRFANLLDLGGATGIELKSAEGKIVVHEVPVPQRFENPEDLGGILHDGESRRMLTDVSPGLPASLPEGQYHARIVYAANRRKQFWSKSFEIKFRDPTKTEADWITSLAPDRSKALAWTDWTYTRPKQPVFTGEINPENPLKLNLILRRLFFGPESLEQVNPDTLDVLTSGRDSKLYEPEMWALKAELYQAHHDQQKYKDCVARIDQSTSGMQWWIRMLEGGGGFLSTFRLGPER